MLTIDKIKNVIQKIAPEYKLKRVTLFGSRAKGNFRDDSDIDLIVEFETKAVSLFTLSGLMIDLEEIVRSAAMILDNKGRFAMVHRPDRMIEIINMMQKYDIEPKRIRFVYPKIGKESHIFLIEGMYKGNKGVKIETPLYAHEDDGSYSKEVRMMFGENEDEQTEKF